MPGIDGSTANCGQMQQAIRQGNALTVAERAHVEGCDACLEVWLDATVTQTLDTKPEVRIPADFAARVAKGLPANVMRASTRPEHAPRWGLITAIALVAAGLMVMAVTDPVRMNTWVGVVFAALVVTEIAGIALWLGCWPHGRTASRSHS